MGAWSVDAFGNDDALDWAYELEGQNDLTLVEITLDKVLAMGSGYLEVPQAAEALIAIEVIARLQGNWGKSNSYTEIVDNWVKKTKLKPSMELAQKAHRSIARILAKNSELMELWQESDEFDAWYAFVQELKSRVRI